jgi:selenocysteine lyase/cysteine desulfurase
MHATTRASFGIYNDESDVDRLAEAVTAAQAIFAR